MSYVSNTLYQGSSQHDLTTGSQSSENTISNDLGVEIHTPADDRLIIRSNTSEANDAVATEDNPTDLKDRSIKAIKNFFISIAKVVAYPFIAMYKLIAYIFSCCSNKNQQQEKDLDSSSSTDYQTKNYDIFFNSITKNEFNYSAFVYITNKDNYGDDFKNELVKQLKRYNKAKKLTKKTTDENIRELLLKGIDLANKSKYHQHSLGGIITPLEAEQYTMVDKGIRLCGGICIDIKNKMK